MSAPERTEAEMAERIAAFEAAPPAPETRGQIVVVTWFNCTCDWTTKFCEEFHSEWAVVPLWVLRDYQVKS